MYKHCVPPVVSVSVFSPCYSNEGRASVSYSNPPPIVTASSAEGTALHCHCISSTASPLEPFCHPADGPEHGHWI